MVTLAVDLAAHGCLGVRSVKRAGVALVVAPCQFRGRSRILFHRLGDQLWHSSQLTTIAGDAFPLSLFSRTGTLRVNSAPGDQLRVA